MAPGGSQQCWHLTVKVLPQNPNLAPMKFRTPVLNPQLYKSPHILYPTPLISIWSDQMRSTTRYIQYPTPCLILVQSNQTRSINENCSPKTLQMWTAKDN